MRTTSISRTANTILVLGNPLDTRFLNWKVDTRFTSGCSSLLSLTTCLLASTIQLHNSDLRASPKMGPSSPGHYLQSEDNSPCHGRHSWRQARQEARGPGSGLGSDVLTECPS